MGSSSLRGMVSGPLSLSRAEIVRWHLCYNHYPPLDDTLTASCLRAIERAARDKWDARIVLPPGYRNRRDGKRTILVRDLVEFCHLDDLVERRRAELFGAEDWE